MKSNYLIIFISVIPIYFKFVTSFCRLLVQVAVKYSTLPVFNSAQAMKSVYMANIENRRSVIDEMSDIAFIDIDDDDTDSYEQKIPEKTEGFTVKRSLITDGIESETERVGVFDYFSEPNKPLIKTSQSASSNVGQCGSDNYYLGPRSTLPMSNIGAKNFKEASQRAFGKFSTVNDNYDSSRLYRDRGWVRYGSPLANASTQLSTNADSSSLDVDCINDNVSTFSSLADNHVGHGSFGYLYSEGEIGHLPFEQRASSSTRANAALYDEAHVVFDSSDSDSSDERRRLKLGQYEQYCGNYVRTSAMNRTQFQTSAESQQRYDFHHKTTQMESDQTSAHFDTRVSFPLSSRFNGGSSSESLSASSRYHGSTERDIGLRNSIGGEKSSSRSAYAKSNDWRSSAQGMYMILFGKKLTFYLKSFLFINLSAILNHEHVLYCAGHG